MQKNTPEYKEKKLESEKKQSLYEELRQKNIQEENKKQMEKDEDTAIFSEYSSQFKPLTQ